MEKDKPLTLEELAEFFSSEIKPEFDTIIHRLDRLEVGQKHIEEEIKSLKADLSDTPTRREFEDLKRRIQRLEQPN